MDSLSVVVTAFVCSGCTQKQVGEPAAALCVECDRKRVALADAQGKSAAETTQVVADWLEVRMRAWVDRQVLTGAIKQDLAHQLDMMLEHAFEESYAG